MTRIAPLIVRPVVYVTPDGRLDPENAARLIGVSVGTLANWRSQLRGPPWFRLEGSTWYRLTRVQQWIDEAERFAEARAICGITNDHEPLSTARALRGTLRLKDQRGNT